MWVHALQKALNGIEKANFEMLHDVFGDAQWTNKRRMSDEKMLDLIEHFSQMKLTVAECSSRHYGRRLRIPDQEICR